MLNWLHEVDGEWFLGVGVGDVDVQLVLLALVERALRCHNHHRYLLDELEVVGVNIVDAVKDPRLLFDHQRAVAGRAPALIAALAVSLAWLTDLLRIVFQNRLHGEMSLV